MVKHEPGGEKTDIEYIFSLYEILAHKARQGYANEGRGVIVLDLSTAPEIGGGYLSAARLLVELGGVPDERLGETMQSYNPHTEFVTLVRRADYSLHGYILKYEAAAPPRQTRRSTPNMSE